MVWMPEHATGGVPSFLLGFNSKTEKWEQNIDLDPDNVVRNPIKWMQSQAFDSKGNLYTTETYEGKRVQRFVYKGMGPANGEPTLFKSDDPKARK